MMILILGWILILKKNKMIKILTLKSKRILILMIKKIIIKDGKSNYKNKMQKLNKKLI